MMDPNNFLTPRKRMISSKSAINFDQHKTTPSKCYETTGFFEQLFTPMFKRSGSFSHNPTISYTGGPASGLLGPVCTDSPILETTAKKSPAAKMEPVAQPSTPKTNTKPSKKSGSATKLQPWSPSRVEACLETRTNIANEILRTEQTYVDSLKAIVEHFSAPLKQMAGDQITTILTHAEIEKVFNNIPVLCTFNSYFLQNLQARMEAFDPQTTEMGNVFLQFAPFFRMYSQYATNFEGVPKLISNMQEKNAKFAQFCQQKQNLASCQIGLLSLLVMPIQRIPRYQLLLEQLLKNTAPQHKDFENLKTSLDLVSKVAVKINQDIERQQNSQSIREYQALFAEEVNFIVPHRRLIRHGPLVKTSYKGDQEFEVFVFNDMIGYATCRGRYFQQHQLVRTFDIAEFHTIESVGDSDEIPSTSSDSQDSAKKELSCFIITGKKESLVFGCFNHLEAEAWITDISKLINKNKTAPVFKQRKNRTRTLTTTNSHKVEWKPDSSTTCCPSCDMAFSFFVRRHHCRQCGDVVCAKCSQARKVVFGSANLSRVCVKCCQSPLKESPTKREQKKQEKKLYLGNKAALHLPSWYTQTIDFASNKDWNNLPYEDISGAKWWRLDDEKSSRQALKAVTIIKASPKAVCAYLNACHFENVYDTVRRLKSHGRTKLVHITVAAPGAFWHSVKRDFVLVKDWQKVPDKENTYMVVSKSVPSPMLPPQAGITRGKMGHNGWILRPVKSEHFTWCELTYIAQLDPRGWVPAWLKNKFYQEQQRVIQALQAEARTIRRLFESIPDEPKKTLEKKGPAWEKFLQACGMVPKDEETLENTGKKVAELHVSASTKSHDQQPHKETTGPGTLSKPALRQPFQRIQSQAATPSSAAASPSKNLATEIKIDGDTKVSPSKVMRERRRSLRKSFGNTPTNNLMKSPLPEGKNLSGKKSASNKENVVVFNTAVVEPESFVPSKTLNFENDVIETSDKHFDKLSALQRQNNVLVEQVVQVEDYMAGKEGKLTLRLETELSKSNLALCEARSENDKLLFKLEQMQDKFVALKKLQKNCPECSRATTGVKNGNPGKKSASTGIRRRSPQASRNSSQPKGPSSRSMQQVQGLRS